MDRQQENEFSIKAKNWLSQAYYRQQPKLTPFLTPREQQLLEGYRKSYEGLSLAWHGGFEGAERRRCLIHLFGEDVDLEAFAIQGFALEYPKKFATVEHRQVLGALMGLQIDRSRIGDIIVDEKGDVYVAVMDEMAAYIKEHLLSAGSTQIRLKEMDLSQVKREEKFEESEIMVASMRLDAIVASILKLSRAQAADCFKEGRIQLNYQLEQNHSRTCQVGDLLSIKRYGRCRILEQVRMTKNEKFVLRIGKTI